MRASIVMAIWGLFVASCCASTLLADEATLADLRTLLGNRTRLSSTGGAQSRSFQFECRRYRLSDDGSVRAYREILECRG